MGRRFPRALGCAAVILCLEMGAACTMGAADRDPPAAQPVDVRPGNAAAAHATPVWKPGLILSVETSEPLGIEDWLPRLQGFDVVFLGEEHQNPEHINAALLVLKSLLAQGRHPLLGMEMFSWDGQAALDRYVEQKEITDRQFLEDTRWKQNWGGAFEDYAPLVVFAREHRMPVRALNPPRPLVRQVVKEGVDAVVKGEEAAHWGMKSEDIVDDPAYREAILDQLKACHGRGMDRDYQGMYEASLFRDEGMAKTIADMLARMKAEGIPARGPFVSYTGGGHIQYRLPVPNRVQRRVGPGLKQVTIYMTSFEPGRTEEVQELLARRIADYLWLTQMGPQGPPRRCR